MKSFQLLIVIFIIFVNPINNVFSQDITLSWDPSPTSEVTGYNVYYKQGDSNFPFDGTGATEGTSPIDVGDTLTTTLTNLNDDVNYFFSVTAYSADAESSFSNIVSNGWLTALVTPTDGASGEPVPVTFQWETAPPDYNVTYTLFYGTDKTEVRNALGVVVPPAVPGRNNLPPIIIGVLVALMLLAFRYLPVKKLSAQTAIFLLVGLIGGTLTACSSGGGSGDSSGDHSATGGSEPTELYSINKGTSDYHQAYNLEPSTTYYWKVVATDTQDPNLTYESEVRQFTTEDF